MNAAQASGVHATEQLLFYTLLQLAIIVLAGRAGGALAKRVGQAQAVGEIVIGIVLGPSLFGLLAPELFERVFRSTPPQPLNILSQVGLLLLMFQIGLGFDFSHLSERRNRSAVTAVSAAGLVLPFALGLGFAWLVPDAFAVTTNRLGFALFVATAFSITALPVLGRIMFEFGMARSPLGVIAISAAAVSDVVGWLLLALVTALASSAFVPLAFGLQTLGVLAFAALAWWVVRPLLVRLVRRQLHSADAEANAAAGAGADGHALPPTLMGIVIAVIFVAGMCTYQLGIFAIFGGFMMGVLLHREERFVQAWNDKVGAFVNVFFLPVFFAYTGLRTDIGMLGSAEAWLWCALLIVLATLGKFGGCYVAARLAGLAHAPALVLGALMNTRGLMELIILNVGFDLGLISHSMFTMLVLMAIVSTVATSPALRRWLPAASAALDGSADGAINAASRPAAADAPRPGARTSSPDTPKAGG